MARRLTKDQRAQLKETDDSVRFLSKAKPEAKKAAEPAPRGIDPKVVTEIFLKACNHMISAFENMKPPTVIIPKIEVPPPPAAKQVSSIEITGISRNAQNRIEGVKMNVQYED